MRNGAEERVLGVRTTLLERAEMPWVTAVFQDITDSRQIEDLLRRTERLQAVAELGASLAHEIKNPLASIRSAVEQLGGTNVKSEHDKTILSRLVVTESDRVSRLLSEFMEFSRVEVRRRSEVDVAKLTANVQTFISQGVKAQLLDEKLAGYDLKRLGAALKPERDLQFNYLGLQTLYDRYFLHINDHRIELP